MIKWKKMYITHIVEACCSIQKHCWDRILQVEHVVTTDTGPLSTLPQTLPSLREAVQLGLPLFLCGDPYPRLFDVSMYKLCFTHCNTQASSEQPLSPSGEAFVLTAPQFKFCWPILSSSLGHKYFGWLSLKIFLNKIFSSSVYPEEIIKDNSICNLEHNFNII